MTEDIVYVGDADKVDTANTFSEHVSPLCETCKEALEAYDLAISLTQAYSLGHTFDRVEGEARDEAKEKAKYDRLLLTTDKSLLTRAATGCHLCQSLLNLNPIEDTEAKEDTDTPSAAEQGVSRFTMSYTQNLDLMMFLSSNSYQIPRILQLKYGIGGGGQISDDQMQSVRLFVNPIEDLSDIPGNMEENTGSEITLAIIDSWMLECLSTHDCHSLWTGFETCFVPTYLIDVGDANPPRPRLCEGEESRKQCFRYLTLSHCWGSVQPLTLTNSNLKTMLEGFDFNKVSKTFQDAMMVVRRLRQRYLWIDSLCIIQDSVADWLSESSAMGQVYSNSICNICATAAQDGDGGIFHDRDPMEVKPLVVPIKDGDTAKLCTLYPKDFWKDDVQNAPLNRRAWVCQERLLSTCNLHFAAKQVFWECRAKTACESAPGHIAEAFVDAYIKRNISRFLSLTERIPDDAPSWEQPGTFWHHVTSLFTAGELTFATDKLVAVSGLAAQMYKITNDDYLAGLWRTNLVDQLLWVLTHRDDLEFPDPTDHKYVAPSWSWASTRGEVGSIYLPRQTKDVLMDIIEAQVELASDVPFGQVKAGHITIKGKLAKAAHRDTGRSTTNGFVPPALHVQVDDGWANPSTQLEQDKLIGAYYSMSRDRVLSQDGIVYLLPCIKDKLEWPGRNQPGFDQLECLVLVETGRKPGEFYRCGSLSAHAIKDDSNIRTIENGCRYFDGKLGESKLECSEDLERGLVYTVTII